MRVEANSSQALFSAQTALAGAKAKSDQTSKAARKSGTAANVAPTSNDTVAPGTGNIAAQNHAAANSLRQAGDRVTSLLAGVVASARPRPQDAFPTDGRPRIDFRA